MKRLIAIALMFVAGCSSQIRIDAIIPDSLHSNHANQCNPDCALQDNGGQGYIVTIKGTDKNFNVGYGKIYGRNSFNNDLEVDIFQLAKAEFNWKFINPGIAIWNMTIQGYFDETGKPITHNITWPVPELSINPLYYWGYDLWITGTYINFIRVEITLLRMGYRF